MPPKRRHLSGREMGSGAGAPRSLQDQIAFRQASRHHMETIIKPLIERSLADRTIPLEVETQEFDETRQERINTQNIDTGRMQKFLGSIASHEIRGDNA